MNVYDCFTFNDELEVLEIRLNTLNKYVDKFIIVESRINHQGGKKKINFNINLFKRFRNKINYLLIESLPKNSSAWDIENYQRNYISNGLKDCKPEDIIIISDADEIPNIKNINLLNLKKKYYVFEQDHFFYKLNLKKKNKWLGSKMCKYKNLKNPQWLRALKMHKKYSFWRFDKFFKNNYNSSFEIIKNGGWHFGWLKNIKNIKLKLESFAHTEHNTNFLKNKNYIAKCIKYKINFLDNNEKFEKVRIDKNYPDYIRNNINVFNKWIA